MALPTIVINSATGSDTLASGAGPATALHGANAATAASTLVTLLVDSPDLSGVATDGSAVIWIASSSGRRWAKITAVNNTMGVKTVTVSDAFTNTESAKNWAIGGIRATLGGSTQLGLDMRAGWTIDVQTGETLTANFRVTPNQTAGLTAYFLSTTTTRPVLTTSTNNVCGLDIGGASNLSVQHLVFQSTAGTPGDGVGLVTNAQASCVTFQDCVVDGFRDGVIDADTGQNNKWLGMLLEAVEIKNCTRRGLFINTGSNCKLTNCWVHNNNTSHNIAYDGLQVGQQITAVDCIFDSNDHSNVKVNLSSGYPQVFRNCVFSNATATSALGHGLFIHDVGSASLELQNCIIYGNAGVGVNYDQALAGMCGLINRNNAYGANTGGNRTNFPAGTNDVALTASPFNSGTDFGLNSTAGGGTACKRAAAARIGSANAAGDIGAIPSGGGASGATTIVVSQTVRRYSRGQ